MVDLTLPNFKISRVAKATGVSVNTIRSWYQRKHFTIGMTDKAPGGEGMASFVSARTAIAIGIAGALTNMCISPKRAANAGLLFAHTGASDPETKAERNPGRLFPDGETVIVLAADADWRDGKALIFNTNQNTKLSDIFNVTTCGQDRSMGITCLKLNELVMGIYMKLGIDPIEKQEHSGRGE